MAGEHTGDDPIIPQGVTLRAFDDTKAARAGIYSGTIEALKKRFPLESKSHRLELSDIRYTGPQEFTLAQQKHALLSDKPLHTPITGHFRLVDKASGAVVDERDAVVMDVPYYTDRGTVINNGSEYTVANQLRLRPGVYTRIRRSGDVETQFNVKPGTGRGFRLRMEPSTGVVTVNVGHANMPLYPLLRTMGVTDQQMIKAWGADVAYANAENANSTAGRSAVDKLYKAFAGYNATAQDLVSKERYISETLPKFELDPGVTSRTLGIAASGITPDVLLRAASKMFNVNRGEEKPDDRDNPGFANVYGIEDLYRERIEKDAGKLSRNIMWKLSRAGSLKPLGRAAFSGWHNELLHGSGLAMPGDNSNPMALEEQMMRVTRMGEGGIGSEDVVTDTARQINPGNLNFIDLLAGPENCMPGDAEVMTDAGWVRWDSVAADTVFACMVGGRLEYHKAEALHVYDFDGTLYCGKSRALAYKYTPNHRMWCAPLGHRPRFRFELAKDVHGTKGRVVMTGGHQPFAGAYQEFFQLPAVVNPGNAYKPIPAIPMRDWAAFMGWYLTEGSTRYVPNKVFHVHIAQQKGGCLAALDKVIATMPFKMYAVYKTVGGKRIQYGYSGSSRQLCEYLRTFGLAYDKYIPDYLLNADPETRKALFTAILLGDGRRKRDTFTFCSASRRFADTFVRLAFGLGYTTHLRFERDDRPISRTGGMWCVHVLKGDHHQIVNDKHRSQMYTEHYAGKVYCATVPGGLMYCRCGDGLGYWTGNSKIGVDARLGVYTRKGSDGKLYSLFINRQGRKEYVASDKASDSVIGFPNPDPKADSVPAMKDGRVQMVPRDEVDYFVPSMAGLFSSNVNLNPMPTALQGGRQFYGAKFWGQYMPTVNGEVPLVDSLMPDGKSTWGEHYGRRLGTLRSPAAGTVTKVSDKGVTVTDESGKKHFVETVVDFPFNGLTGLTYTPTVKVGDTVAANDMLAASNFVDKKTGGLAMGVNLHMAWLPYKGFSYEDSIVISESAAKKLATDRLYGFEADPRDGVELGLNKYMSAFPKKFTKEQFATLDDNGVVKEGTVLNKGDPISVGVGPKLLTAEDANLGKLSKVLRNAFTDKAQVWDHDYPGTVVSSTVFRGRAKVNIKATPPIQIGDKLSPRGALKGVCGRIVPDDKMPRDAVTNEPYDILMNPMGIPSRVAPGQLIETALGKLAKATGKQARIPQDPPPEGWAMWASNQLAAAGVSPTADVFDPETGRTLHGIGDGYVYFHAMHHLADKKISAKGGSGGYTADLQPAKGGKTGAKRNSSLDTYALIAHGATEVMKDVQTVRGTKNEEFWKSVRSGGPLPAPQVPFVYQKAMNLLRAGGINVVEGQTATDIMPMTDADTDKLTGGRIIENSRMLDDDMKELKGGLFDPYMTGGNGNRSRWAAIALPEPIPNPVMEEPVRRLLGLTGKKLQAVISGEEKLNGLTGGKALQAALGAVDVDAEIARQRDIARKARGSVRDNAIKVIGYLSGCKKQGVSPKDWMISKVPVIPPMFRPIAKLGDTALVSDINELYRDVIESADAFRQLKADVPDSGLTEERMNVYNAVKAAYGLGDPISPEGQAKRLKGAIRQVIGNSPKQGLFQAKVLSKAVDGVGRAVISPEPNYDMDQCGIPEDAVWTLYKDYVIRGLRRRGYPEERAMQLVEEKAKVAKDLLVEEMGRRPVILDRAPTWHKFNLMAFWPTLVEGDTMRMNPVVEKAYTADHDGDLILGKIVISCNLSELNAVTVVGGRKVSVKKLLHGAVKNGILRAMNIKKDIPLLKAATDGESIVVVDFEDIPVGKLERTTQGQNGPIEWYKPAVPFSVAAYDEQTGAPVWAPVRWVTRHPQRVIEVVTLNYGNQIITDDDPRAVYGMDPASPDMAMARFTPSDALARHVVVPVARGTMQQLCSSAGALDHDGVLPLNGDTGYLLGALAGDGWWDKSDYGSRERRVYLADLHGDVARRVEHVLRTLYGTVRVSCHEFHKEDSPARYGDTARYTYAFSGSSAVTAHLTEILGGAGDADTAGSANKHLPVYILNTSAEFRRGMLCGLMDTDGTVALTKGGSRARPQLALQFVSTSLRLCRDVALLAESVGVRASVSFSKQTVRGNSAWMTVLSAKDAKATDVLASLADAGKRSRFIQAEVDADHVNSAFDTVVLPLVVRDALLPWLPTTTKEERADYQRVWQAKEHGVIARYIVPRILARLEKLWADRKVAIAEAAALLADKAARRDYSVTPEEIAVVRRGITMLAHKSGDRALYDAGQKVYKNTVRPLKTGRMPESTLSLLYGFLKDTEVGPCVTESPLVRLWRDRFVANESVGWDRVVAVEKTGKREDGYDLNVPGYETYMSVDGTILSNTMNFHVPASDKAVAEAVEKMLPSKNLFSTTDLRSPRYVPMMEMTLGLAKLTAPASDAKPKVFVTARDAIRAYRRGEVGANDPVTVLEAQ